jgi:shikimate dehydrogenase
MHNAAFADLGISAHYERWHTPAADLPARIAALREPLMLGANVTLPHKIAVLEHVDHHDPEVVLIGAANTIIRASDGSLTAANTDAPAVLATLREDAHFDPSGQTIAILGASGAARAAAYALATAGCGRLIMINRTLETAETLLADLIEALDLTIPVFALTPDDTDLLELLNQAQLIINATSLGWQADQTPLAQALIQPNTLIFDMVYRPTRLLREAEQRGARTLNGKGMLVRQAGLAFERWTGQTAPFEVMLQAFEQDQH